MTRKAVSSGAPWEAKFGYTRAVRVGPCIKVSGTTGVDENGQVVGGAYEQSRQALEIIRNALAELDAGMSDVVRTRVFVTNVADWEEVGRAHADAFSEAPPASTLVEVSGLIDPAMLVEIEAEAYVE